MLLLAAAALWLRPDPLTVGIALLIPAIGALGYVWLRAHRLAAGIAANGNELSFPAAAPGFDRAPLDIGAVVPIGAGIVLSALYFRIDVLLIGAWIGTEAVAVYNAVFRLVEALRLLPAAMLAVALPSLCRATTREPLVRIATLVTAGGLIIAATLWAAAPWLVPMLYGGAYAEGVPVFRILLLAFPLMCLNYALTHQVIGWNGHRTYAAACAAALAVNVALNARWIPAMGIAGSAWATVATELVVTGGCAAFLTRRRSQTIVTGGSLDLESPGVSI
jgi:O-antigen/teichoic acid export membrane protein